MNIAITGGTGFVGRHVVARLVAEGISPILVVRPSSDIGPELDGLRIVRLDLSAAPADAFRAIGEPDVLIHLAWGGLPNYQALRHFEAELPAQYGFLKSVIEGGLRSLLVTGTCFEYGARSGALAEHHAPRPTTPYGFAKDALRRQLEFLRSQHPFNLTWARLFFMHGEGQGEASLGSQLRRAVARGDRTFAMSGGEQLRDYLPVTEVARQLVSLARTGAAHGVVNVCSGVPISVRRLVEGWLEEHGWDIELAFGRYPYPEHEPMAFWGDRTKLDLSLNVE